MTNMPDPFIGTWTLNVDQSQFSAHHRPTEATMVFAIDEEGHHVMRAEGRNAQGEKVAERPQRFIADGVERPLPDFPQLIAISTRPDANTLKAVVRRADGTTVGQSTIVVAPDGRSLTATNSGIDGQLRAFTQRTVFDRA